MIIDRLPEDRVSEYIELIQAVCSLSNLFSESGKPFIHYHANENMFCRTFDAYNLSRSDATFDAKLKNWCIGIKTFVETSPGKAGAQKIAKFNSESVRYRDLKDDEIVRYVSELRNNPTSTVCNLNHCSGL